MAKELYAINYVCEKDVYNLLGVGDFLKYAFVHKTLRLKSVYLSSLLAHHMTLLFVPVIKL